MLRPSPNHGTQRLPNNDDDDVQNVYKGRPLGRRDIVSVNTTDTDNGFLYQPREVRRMRKQQSHSAVVGTREANGRFRGAQAPSRDIFV